MIVHDDDATKHCPTGLPPGVGTSGAGGYRTTDEIFERMCLDTGRQNLGVFSFKPQLME